MRPRPTPLALLADAHPTLVAERPTYPLRDLTEEERVAHSEREYVKFEQYPASAGDGGHLVGRFWTQDRLDTDVRTLTFDCPFHEDCDAGQVAIPTAPKNGPLGWGRSGNDLETITITPSIKRGPRGGCEWHGHVTLGRFDHCGDSR